jgi:predicted secreted protein with PEFG-CTERM motif
VKRIGKKAGLGYVSVIAFFVLFPTTLGANAQETSSPGNTGGVHLGNMAISPVGNQPLMYAINGTVSDGFRQVQIVYSPSTPVSGYPLSMALTFLDANGNLIPHQNYAISVKQDGIFVFSNTTGHTHTGYDTQKTNNLLSSNPVDIQITLNGVGLPGTDPSSWTGPKGDVLNFHIIPEFGPIALLVLVISIASILVITAKSRVIPRL